MRRSPSARLNVERDAVAMALRWLVLGFTVAVTAWAAWLFVRFAQPDGWTLLDTLRLVLSSICVFWLGWGAGLGLVGVFSPRRRRSGDEPAPLSPSRTAILVPVYNEDPRATFARVAAMSTGLSAIDAHENYSVFILSDTTSLEVAAQEAVWFDRLLATCPNSKHIFYRRRPQNIGRKAGNIADFIRQSGAAFDYALVLDADSLIEPETIIEMVHRMDQTPRLGLLQSLPRVIHARSVFGRIMQFCASYYSPVIAGGLAQLQGPDGPFWGHNAVFRVRAFAQSCGLPELSGKPPFGGHILSHDYVEAALLSRAGWEVRLDHDLMGSYEEGPDNAIDFAKRDRRWCQGNLQHHRIIFGPGLHAWNRMTLLQGIMAYVLSPLWLVLLLVSVAAAAVPAPRFARPENAAAGLTLAGLIIALLLLPKLLVVVRGFIDGRNRAFGGTFLVVFSVMGEIVFSTLLAPVMLLFQTRSVLQVLLGADGGWPASNRADGSLSVSQAWMASSWITLLGAASLAAMLLFAPGLADWSLAVIIPAMLAPLFIAWSSRRVRALEGLWRIPEEDCPALVMEAWADIHKRWGGFDLEPETPAGDLRPARPANARS